ncbi:uncharacterized protein [Clytia hemisphaerica]|uniref:Uncharacterized protein n=1 Tax=Clytia hemisphaerica TaxID=252671 RepID=A0A7M5XL07_9CNID
MKTDKGILVVCKNLLYAVGARYAYYTYLLRHITTSDVSLCKVDPDDKIYKPLEMCYPVQTGPVMCTSDVEFGLVGKEAGTAVLQYNKYIATQRCDVKGAQKPCNAETMLDGLIRSDALEIAAPDIFLPTNPSDKGQVAKLEKQKKILASLDKSYYMKWFDLVLAMIPVFRQDSSVSSRFINDLISLSVDDLQENFKSFLQGISTKNAAQVYTSFNKIAEIITAKTDDQRNDQSAKMFDEIFMEIRNHLKAAKSYHSFGAIRSINVASQMKHKEMINKISLNDYISSAIENFGHTQESMDKCLAKKPQSIPQCIAESSKYLWRTYSTLKAAKDILVDVGQGESLSEQAKMETVKARDYVAELFFIFKKNKKDLPSEYFSAMAYKEDIQLEEEGKNEMKTKTYKATELLKKFMKCDSGDSCMKKVSDAVVEYAKSMLAYQDKNSAWKKVILDKVINKHYFDYVTEPKDKIVNCYKDFLLGIKDPCQIKANTKDKATV